MSVTLTLTSPAFLPCSSATAEISSAHFCRLPNIWLIWSKCSSARRNSEEDFRHLPRDLINHGHRLAAALLKTINDALNFRGGFLGAAGQGTHFIGHHRKASPDSPALAASMAALSANRLVCSAMAPITDSTESISVLWRFSSLDRRDGLLHVSDDLIQTPPHLSDIDAVASLSAFTFRTEPAIS